jgi:DNA-binding CsgD family transcriptional regulator
MGCLAPEAWKCLDESSNDFSRGRSALRENAEQICRRLDWLDKPDRLLLEMVYEQGLSLRKTAALLHRSPSTVTRRICTLLKGLFSREYQLCLQSRSRLTPLQMNIARQYYVQKKSRRRIAQFHRISLYAVQRQLRQVKAVIDCAERSKAPLKQAKPSEGASSCCG